MTEQQWYERGGRLTEGETIYRFFYKDQQHMLGIRLKYEQQKGKEHKNRVYTGPGMDKWYKPWRRIVGLI